MFVPDLFRDAVGTIGPSDIVKMFGVWEDGALLAPHELVLFQMKTVGGNFQRFEVDWAIVDTVRGTSCFDTGGPRLGVVGSFQNPRFFPNAVSPVVRIHPRGGLDTTEYLKWKREDAVPVEKVTPALGALEVIDVGLRVTIPEGGDARSRQYLTTRDTTAAVVEFDQVVGNLEGSPIIQRERDDLPRLVGMLFNLRVVDGRSVGYCFPAAAIR